MAATAVAEFDDVTKEYRTGLLARHTVPALRGVSFRVEPGEVLGLLGPNRAGKTTLVKILLSLCRPTSGRVTRFQRPLSDRSTLARIGYVHENQAFPRYLSAAALLEYYGCLSLMEEPKVRRRVPELLELVGLADRGREPIARFSKGMVQRLGLAQALINDPDLLVFDEPAEGLDLDGQRLIHEVIAGQRRHGRSVLFISHSVEAAGQLCDRVAVLVRGKLAYLGTTAALTAARPEGTRPTLAQALQELYGKGCP